MATQTAAGASKTFTPEEKNACSIDAMLNGEAYQKKALQQNLWVNFGSGSFPSV